MFLINVPDFLVDSSENHQQRSMKSYTKTELARAAGVSGDTFRRWLKTEEAFLRANNVQPKTKYLPPVVVKYLCEKYCIDV